MTNLQQELIRVFSYNLTEQELEEVRALLSDHFAEKATQEMDKLWDENGWSNDTIEDWLKEHHRTPYSKNTAASVNEPVSN